MGVGIKNHHQLRCNNGSELISLYWNVITQEATIREVLKKIICRSSNKIIPRKI